ncbi:MAG TPA: Flp pilus assembly protein CpaB [Planctomicrobium sp.]|nr:Flp pilus assembly protein CpaB [Planctomicrobium sp.]
MSKGNSGSLTVVIFALLIGLGGAFVVRQQVNRPQGLPPLPPSSNGPQTIYVPTAALDLGKGHVLTLADISILSFTPEQLGKSSYAGKVFMRDTAQMVGRAVKVPVAKGGTFMPDLLYPEGLGMGIDERLQPGYRAVTVPIKEVGALVGFARPGSMVDVLFRADSEKDRPEQTLTLLERIQVLALNTVVLPDSQVDLKQSGTVTLAVTPSQAKVLKVVEGRGELSLALRNPNDTFNFSPVDLSDLDPRIGQVSHHSGALARHAVEARNTSDADTIERLLADGSERVTLNDLLGIPRPKPKKEIEIYRAGSKEILAFDIDDDSDLQLLDRGGRIRVPIAHDRPGITPGGLGAVRN